MGRPFHGLTPDRSRIRPKSSYAQTGIDIPALLVPGLRPVSVKTIRAALRAARTLPLTELRPALAEGQGCG
jgi:hypothetical protein